MRFEGEGSQDLRHPTNIRICTRLLVATAAEHRHNYAPESAFKSLSTPPSPLTPPLLPVLFTPGKLTLMFLTIIPIELIRV